MQNVKIGLKAFKLILREYLELRDICCGCIFCVFVFCIVYNNQVLSEGNPPMVKFSQEYLEIRICK